MVESSVLLNNFSVFIFYIIQIYFKIDIFYNLPHCNALAFIAKNISNTEEYNTVIKHVTTAHIKVTVPILANNLINVFPLLS